MSLATQGHPRWTGHSREFWQNMIHQRSKWQTIPVYLPWEPHELYKRPYAEYIVLNAWLNESQAGTKIAGRNINNLRYADDTTLLAESKELESLLMSVGRGKWKTGLKQLKIMASSPITLWQIGKKCKQWQIFFLWAPKSLGFKLFHCDWAWN